MYIPLLSPLFLWFVSPSLIFPLRFFFSEHFTRDCRNQYPSYTQPYPYVDIGGTYMFAISYLSPSWSNSRNYTKKYWYRFFVVSHYPFSFSSLLSSSLILLFDPLEQIYPLDSSICLFSFIYHLFYSPPPFFSFKEKTKFYKLFSNIYNSRNKVNLL